MSRANSTIAAITQVDGPVAGPRAGELQKCKSRVPTLVSPYRPPHTEKWAGEAL